MSGLLQPLGMNSSGGFGAPPPPGSPNPGVLQDVLQRWATGGGGMDGGTFLSTPYASANAPLPSVPYMTTPQGNQQ